MYLVVGLGNPGKEYQRTRHNVGFMVADELRQQWQQQTGQTFSQQHKFESEVWTAGRNLIVLKPQTFMNASGQAVAAVSRFYKIPAEQILVIHDDLDLQLGTFKVMKGKGPKIHNGLLSIYEQLGTAQFWHVRVGVDGRAGDRSMPGSAYVLEAFTTAEQPLIKETIAVTARAVLQQVATASGGEG